MTVVATDALAAFVTTQRWFGARSRPVAGVRVAETIPLGEGLEIAIVEVAFTEGSPERYQLPLGPGREPTVDGTVGDASTDPAFARALAPHLQGGAPVPAPTTVRPLGVEQSNTSSVLDERLVLKLYRRLEAGPSPERELLAFLTAHGYVNIAALRGWFAHGDTTLGLVQDLVPASTNGWELALAAATGPDPLAFAADATALGTVTGALHTALGSDPEDPDFAPEDAPPPAALAATVEAALEHATGTRPELHALATGPAGRVIRHHGDYHLGQVVQGDDRRWTILDFEGEPARSLAERRAKASPLRDVAGMLRSFAYAAASAGAAAGWEDAMRTAFLEAYLAAVDPALLPPDPAATARLLRLLELEKAAYELQYERDHRPDWAAIPAAGIARLLASEAASA